MRFARRAFTFGAATTAIGVVRWPSGAAEFVYKWGTDWPAAHPFAIRMQQAAAKIYQDSRGRLQLRVYPAAVLSSSAQAPLNVRLGTIEFHSGAYATLESSVKAAGLPVLPFAFSSYKEADDAMKGPFGKAMRSLVEKSGLIVFEPCWDGGFRQITTSVRPISVPDDLKGLKIRTAANAVQVGMFKAFGAIPTATDASQAYIALQTHFADGTEIALSSVDAFKLYEVQKYLSIVNSSWTPIPQIANPAAFQKLPRDVQDVVVRNINTAGELANADVVRLDATLIRSLSEKGMSVTQADASAFKRSLRTAGLFAQWRSQYGSDLFDLLESAVGKLT